MENAHFTNINNCKMIDVSTVTVLLFTFTVAVYLLGLRKGKCYPKGPVGVPILGHLPFFGKYPPTKFSQWRQTYGNVFSIRMGSWKTVVVNGYRSIKEAADTPDDVFSSRPAFMTAKVLQEVQGEISLAFGPFDHTYLQHRKLTATALRMFTGRYNGLTEELITEEAGKLTGILLKKSSNRPIDIRSDIQYAAGSVIYQLLYGRGEDVKDALDSIVDNAIKFTKFSENGNPCDVMPCLQYVVPWKVGALREILMHENSAQEKRIQHLIGTFSSGVVTNITGALLDADLQDKNGKESCITRSRLLNTIADLQGAGFDTTNKSLQWLILYMSMYPEVQERVQNEIDDVIISGRRIEIKDRPHLVYTEATILEVMRMTANIPFGLPKFTIKDTVLDGYDIDKGTVVIFNLHSVAHDKDFWGDPNNFRPERLIVNNKLDKEKCNHILPFGLGRRRCLGKLWQRWSSFFCLQTSSEGVNSQTLPIRIMISSLSLDSCIHRNPFVLLSRKDRILDNKCNYILPLRLGGRRLLCE